MAEKILQAAQERNREERKRAQPVMRVPMPPRAAKCLLRHLDFRTRTRFARVCRDWQRVVQSINASDTRTVWIYVIFRRKHATQRGHEKTAVTMSSDGPIFWSKMVVYCYCCSCHFMPTHEEVLLGMLGTLGARVQRLCLVDNPVDYPFLPDSFFHYVARRLPTLQFFYLRQIDLEHINNATVQALAAHPTLKKVIVHQCRNYEAMTDFHQLPQLLVVHGEIQGLKMFIGDIDMSLYTATTSRSASIAGGLKQSAGGSAKSGSDKQGSAGDDSQATDDAGCITPLSECVDDLDAAPAHELSNSVANGLRVDGDEQ